MPECRAYEICYRLPSQNGAPHFAVVVAEDATKAMDYLAQAHGVPRDTLAVISCIWLKPGYIMIHRP